MKHVKLNIRMSVFLLFMCGILSTLGLSAQTGATLNIKGVVKDSKGEALIGATIKVQSTTLGAAADFDGNFSINNVPTDGVLEISYMGYKTQTISVAGKTSFNVVLVEDAELLDEVVVIGYGTVKKEDATGSVIAIKPDEMNKGLTVSASDMLVGKVAGVNVTSSGGEPGAGATTRIRGGASLSASNDPLIVIDGIPMNSSGVAGLSNPLSTVNPADIETFTVLKDASATAIYGSRASNGVIIITTKKGKGNKLKVQYNGNVSVSSNQNKLDVLSADEYRAYIENNFASDPNYTAMVAAQGSGNTDWQDEIYRTAISTDHNLTFLGQEADFFPYRISLGYTNQDGVLLNSNFERYTGSFSFTPHTRDNHLKISLNGIGTYAIADRADQGAIGAAASFDPTQVVKNGSPYGGYFTWTEKNGLPTTIATKNPVAMLEMKKDVSKARSFVGNTQFDYKLHFFPDLRFNANLGLEYSDSYGTVITDENSPMSYNDGGYLKKWGTINKNELLDFYAQYEKDFEKINSHFDIMGGYSWQHFYQKGNQTENGIVPINASGDYKFYSDPRTWAQELYLISFFARANLSIKNKYLLTGTFRRDGTSRFVKDNRWGDFFSAALAWKINEEAFLKDVNAISEMKLRLGWGQTGQQNVGGYYPSQPVYSMGQGQSSYYFGTDADGNPVWVNVIRPSAYDPGLKWEETTTYNIGLDYGFLGGRITGAIDVYKRVTDDLLNGEVKVPAGANFGEYVAMNIGSLENTGVEFSINAKPIVTRDFTWDLGFNIAHNKSEITKLTNGAEEIDGKPIGWVGGDGGYYGQMHKTGYAPSMFWVLQQVYDENGNPLDGIYQDRNGDGIIDNQDRFLYKNPTPDVTMGFNSKFLYKNWDLGFNARASIGNYVYNNIAGSNSELTALSIFGRNQFNSNIYRSATETKFTNKEVFSSHYIQNASFLKIDNITLGYSFAKLFTNKISGRVFGTVQNPFCFTKYDGLDPELDGIDNNIYPRPLTCILGVNLNF